MGTFTLFVIVKKIFRQNKYNTRTHSMARHRKSPHSRSSLMLINPLTPSQGHLFDGRLKFFSVFLSTAHPL